MFRSIVNSMKQITKKYPLSFLKPSSSLAGFPGEEDLENYADLKFEEYFNRPDIDGWEVRKAMNEILGMDMVPYPTTIIAGVNACRRVNDFALAVRWLEGVKHKTGNKKNEIWPYILHEVKGCLDELGVNTPEELCYHRPELALKSVYDL